MSKQNMTIGHYVPVIEKQATMVLGQLNEYKSRRAEQDWDLIDDILLLIRYVKKVKNKAHRLADAYGTAAVVGNGDKGLSRSDSE